MQTIYLDYAAATPMDPKVLEAMEPYYSEFFYNPSAIYMAGRRAKKALDDARIAIARHLGAKPSEIIFTAGATEANNLAIRGIAEAFPKAEILVSAVEHDSILEPARLHGAKIIPIDTKGIIILNKLSNLINDKTGLISVMLVNNELGSIQPVRDVANLIKDIRTDRQKRGVKLPIYLHTDAAQAANFLDLHVSRLGVDLLSLNGGKIYGPKQSGVLFVKTGTRLQPQILGGGQEFGLRSGTENLSSAVGLAKALDISQSLKGLETKRLIEIRQIFAKKLQTVLSQTVINGSDKHNTPHILHATFPGVDNETLMFQLDEAGIQVAIGSACSASSDEPSHVLKAIGLNDEQSRSSLRFSMGRQTNLAQIETTLDILKKLLARKPSNR